VFFIQKVGIVGLFLKVGKSRPLDQKVGKVGPAGQPGNSNTNEQQDSPSTPGIWYITQFTIAFFSKIHVLSPGMMTTLLVYLKAVNYYRMLLRLPGFCAIECICFTGRVVCGLGFHGAWVAAMVGLCEPETPNELSSSCRDNHKMVVMDTQFSKHDQGRTPFLFSTSFCIIHVYMANNKGRLDASI